MSSAKRIRAAYYFQQKAGRAKAEVFWHLSSLPGALFGWVCSSFEFLALAAFVLMLGVLQYFPDRFDQELSRVVFSSATLSVSSGHGESAPAPPLREEITVRHSQLTQLAPDALESAVFGLDRPAWFEAYFNYLEQNKDAVDDSIWTYFSDYRRYSLVHESSLVGTRFANFRASDEGIVLRLTDPKSDVGLSFEYQDVSALNTDAWNNSGTVIAHELFISPAGRLVHSFVFDNRRTTQIESARIRVPGLR